MKTLLIIASFFYLGCYQIPNNQEEEKRFRVVEKKSCKSKVKKRNRCIRKKCDNYLSDKLYRRCKNRCYDKYRYDRCNKVNYIYYY